MKIAHINLSNKNGGAANATMRLHKSLLKLGVNSKVFTQRLDSEKTPNIVSGSLLERKLFSNIRYFFMVIYSYVRLLLLLPIATKTLRHFLVWKKMNYLNLTQALCVSPHLLFS